MDSENDNTAVIVQPENAVAKTAQEVFEYVKGKLAPVVKEKRDAVEIALNKTKAIAEIATPEQYTAAIEAKKELTKSVKDGKSALADMKNKAHYVHKAFTTSENEVSKDVADEEKRIARLASAYDAEQERIRMQAQREAEAKARKEAEDRAIEEAAKLEALGDTEAAEEVISEPVIAPVVEIAKTTPKVEGSHYRDNWKVKSVDASKLTREYMMPDMVKINAAVKANKADTNIAGIEVINDRILVAK